MLSRLPPREREILNLLYEHGQMAVADICGALGLSGSAVRTMLKRLTAKGFVRRTGSEREGHFYSPSIPQNVASRGALAEIVRVFFKGSPAGAASALLGLADSPDASELDKIEAMISKVRAARKRK